MNAWGIPLHVSVCSTKHRSPACLGIDDPSGRLTMVHYWYPLKHSNDSVDSSDEGEVCTHTLRSASTTKSTLSGLIS